MTGRQPVFGPGSIGCCLSSCQTPGIWIGAARLSTAPPLPRKGGCRDRPEPNGSWAKPGTKRLSVVDRRGTPLGVRLSPANRHDSLMLAATLDAVPGVRHGRGRPRRRPDKLHADKAYDHHRCRAECRKRRVTPRIAGRRVDSSERLGRHRWVVERTLAWLNRFRRLAMRLTSVAPTSTRLS